MSFRHFPARHRPMSVRESEAKRAEPCLHCRMTAATIWEARRLLTMLSRELREAAPNHPLPDQVAAYIEANETRDA